MQISIPNSAVRLQLSYRKMQEVRFSRIGTAAYCSNETQVAEKSYRQRAQHTKWLARIGAPILGVAAGLFWWPAIPLALSAGLLLEREYRGYVKGWPELFKQKKAQP